MKETGKGGVKKVPGIIRTRESNWVIWMAEYSCATLSSLTVTLQSPESEALCRKVSNTGHDKLQTYLHGGSGGEGIGGSNTVGDLSQRLRDREGKRKRFWQTGTGLEV